MDADPWAQLASPAQQPQAASADEGAADGAAEDESAVGDGDGDAVPWAQLASPTAAAQPPQQPAADAPDDPFGFGALALGQSDAPLSQFGFGAVTSPAAALLPALGSTRGFSAAGAEAELRTAPHQLPLAADPSASLGSRRGDAAGGGGARQAANGAQSDALADEFAALFGGGHSCARAPSARRSRCAASSSPRLR
jgi:hypothetical protein